MMRSDSVIKMEGMQALLDKLGKVDAERFVSLVLKEPFDYNILRKPGSVGLPAAEFMLKLPEACHSCNLSYTVWRSFLQEEKISLRDLSRRAMEDMHS